MCAGSREERRPLLYPCAQMRRDTLMDTLKSNGTGKNIFSHLVSMIKRYIYLMMKIDSCTQCTQSRQKLFHRQICV